MQSKFKLLAAAAVLALSSVSASAAISTASDPSLLFVAWDAAGSGATYTRILGSVSAIGASNATFNAPAGSIFGTQMTGVSAANISWGVYALSNSGLANIYLTGSVQQQQAQSLNDFAVSSTADILTNPLGGLTQLDIAANGYAKPNNEYTGSTLGTDQTNGLTLSNNFSFGAVTAGLGVGTSLNFMKVDDQGNIAQLYTNANGGSYNGNAAGGYFTLLDAAGDVQWTYANGSAVPLPGAAALFVPGLLAMFGIGRRRNKAA